MTDLSQSGLSEIIAAGKTLFPDLEYLAPSGVLDLAVPQGPVRRLRIEAAPGQFLHFQSLALVTADGDSDDLTGLTTVETSSWYKEYGNRFDLRRLLDFENPVGTMVHTTADDQAWCEVTFSRPVDLKRIKLRNVAQTTASRARGIRVLVERDVSPLPAGAEAAPPARTPWGAAEMPDTRQPDAPMDNQASRELVLYDHQSRGEELLELLSSLPSQRPLDRELERLLPILGLTFEGAYADARKALDAAEEISDEDKRAFRLQVSQQLLLGRRLEWTIHGPQRCFRFWSDHEKVNYVRLAADVAQALKSLTPNVCFGFGAALCVVREGDLIPHDDDLDLIIGFDPHEAVNLPEALRRIGEHLRPLGFTVTGNYSAHRQVRRGSGKHVDVFAGLFEGDTISWYPGTRGSLDRHMMFPTSEARLFGVPVPLPRNPLEYLERLYGPGWRSPDPNFRHTWDRSAYADLVTRGVEPATAGGERRR